MLYQEKFGNPIGRVSTYIEIAIGEIGIFNVAFIDYIGHYIQTYLFNYKFFIKYAFPAPRNIKNILFIHKSKICR
jgi:hypothetical protein